MLVLGADLFVHVKAPSDLCMTSVSIVHQM